MIELPACAAIQTEEGFIIAGKRHCDCISQLHRLEQFHQYRRQRGSEIQGFMTNLGRFVNRSEAWNLFRDNDIFPPLVGSGYKGPILFSENLY